MIYESAADWGNAPQKRVLLFGMSGLGKTHVSNLLRSSGDWFHYSIDYRIGTRYMGEHIADNFKREAMKVPLLRELLMTDSVHITSNITFNDLSPVSSYLGKPGDPAKGGVPIDEYRRRQEQFRHAEIAALLDTPHFIDRSRSVYGYPHFICDTGGSICEWVDPEDGQDRVLSLLSRHLLMVWIEGSDAHTEDLIRRFDKAPKPMSYRADFLTATWGEYLSENNLKEDQVDPDLFIRFTYARALAHRTPLYRAMARNWGISVRAEDAAKVRSAADFEDLIAVALEKRRKSA
ncbi:MAG: ATPase [Rhodobacteraceae bacterium]|nr:ATPase [Paracoccaceae bacterium]